jgi:hypothetical protein
LGDDNRILSSVMHHFISDRWSMDVLRRELDQFYAAVLRGEDRLPIQYRLCRVAEAGRAADRTADVAGVLDKAAGGQLADRAAHIPPPPRCTIRRGLRCAVHHRG